MDALDFIKSNFELTSVDSRTYEIPNTGRDTLAKIFDSLGFTVGAEIGVERGLYSEVLLKANPNLKLYSIDAWSAYHGYRDHVTQSKLDGLMEETKTLLSPFGDRSVVVKGFSTDVVKNFQDESLDFVYIDGNHEYQHVVNDISEWHRKVKIGGIIAGHDYIRRKQTHKKQEYLMHVIPAVHGFLDAYEIRPLFILGRKAKIEGELRDSPRSWFYVRPQAKTVVPGFYTLDRQ